MKKLLLLLFVCQFSFSQQFTCGVSDNLTYNELKAMPANSNFAWTNQNNTFCDTVTRFVFNINFHVVYKSDSTRVVPIGVNEALNAVKHLNKGFNEHNIFFKYRGIHQIIDDDTDSHDLNLVNDSNLSWLMQTYGLPNTFNVFIADPNSTNGYGARAMVGHTHSLFGSMAFLDAWTLCHEIGHNFTIAHPYNGWNTINCEHTTRDEFNLLYNAHNKGDAITDTHATSLLVQFSTTDCTMINNPVDCSSDQVPYLPQSRDNYMFPSNAASGNGNACSPHFTPKQVERMRNKIIADSQNRFSNASTTLESLYEPYEIVNVPGNVIISTEPLSPSSALVCRNILTQHKFQPGFDYEFTNVHNYDPNQSGVEDFPIIQYSTADFEVIIEQINPDCEQTVTVLCTRGQICLEEFYRSGNITSVDDLGSLNYTTLELTEQQLNDPYYIQQLENNKYHIIKKETDSGAIYQVIIYKE